MRLQGTGRPAPRAMRLALLVFVASVAGCAGPPPPPGNAPDAAVAATRTGSQAAVVAQAGPARIRGEVVVGKDGFAIVPCNADRQQRVRFTPAAQRLVDRFLEAGGARPFFLDGWGMADANAMLAIDRIERLHTEGVRCGHAIEQAIFVARGQEPFWSIRLDSAQLVLTRPGERVQSMPATMHAGDAGAYRWSSAAGEGWEVTVTPGYCADGMADAATGWRATLIAQGETLQGCAYRGANPPVQAAK